jgi:hypothetical protein
MANGYMRSEPDHKEKKGRALSKPSPCALKVIEVDYWAAADALADAVPADFGMLR